MNPDKNSNFLEENNEEEDDYDYEDESIAESEENDGLPSEGLMRHTIIALRFLVTFWTTSMDVVEDILRILLNDSFIRVGIVKSSNGEFTKIVPLPARSPSERLMKAYLSHHYGLIIGQLLEMIRQWNLDADDISSTMDVISYFRCLITEQNLIRIYRKRGFVFFLTQIADFVGSFYRWRSRSDSSNDDEEKEDK